MMSQYTCCQAAYTNCQVSDKKEIKVCTPKIVRESKKVTICHPNPFSPNGGAKEWCSNDLLLHDVNMRRLARVRPLDCGVTEMIMLNPEPQI